MNTIKFDITKKHTLERVGRVGDHQRTAIEFVGFELEPDQSLFVVTRQRGKQRITPMTDNIFIVGKPLTLHAGDFKLHLEIRGGSEEWNSKWFTFRIDPDDCRCHNSCGCHCESEDPNIQRFVEEIKYRLDELEGTQITEEDVIRLMEGYDLTEEQIQRIVERIEVSYDLLTDKPSINDVVLVGNKSAEDLGIKIPEFATLNDIDTIFMQGD